MCIFLTRQHKLILNVNEKSRCLFFNALWNTRYDPQITDERINASDRISSKNAPENNREESKFKPELFTSCLKRQSSTKQTEKMCTCPAPPGANVFHIKSFDLPECRKWAACWGFLLTERCIPAVTFFGSKLMSEFGCNSCPRLRYIGPKCCLNLLALLDKRFEFMAAQLQIDYYFKAVERKTCGMWPYWR